MFDPFIYFMHLRIHIILSVSMTWTRIVFSIRPIFPSSMKLLQRQQLQDSRKVKSKLKVNDGLPPNKRFSLTPFS